MSERTLADPERALALVHAPAGCRDALAALWMLDDRLGAATTNLREPMIGAIKLAWWREALAALDNTLPPDEPLLRALSAHVVARGVKGAELAILADGWEAVLHLPADPAALADHAIARGETLWRLSARLLGRECGAREAEAGGGWALADLAARTADDSTRVAALAMARPKLAGVKRWPRRLRPLGMLVALARSDAGREAARSRRGSPARIARMLWHRLSGL
jgi:phytoene synthase